MSHVNQETGRSMVEMIGVLMIFISLSIVGIVSYDYVLGKRFTTELVDLSIKMLEISKIKGYNVTLNSERIPHYAKVMGASGVAGPGTVRFFVQNENLIPDNFLKILRADYNIQGTIQERYSAEYCKTNECSEQDRNMREIRFTVPNFR